MSDTADLDASSDTTNISQSTAKDESCSNEDEEASTDETTAPLRPTTENESSNDADLEAPTDTSEPETPSPFDDPTVRRAFVQKVFSLQFPILLFAVGVVCLFSSSDFIKERVRGNIWVFISSIIIFMGFIINLFIVQSYSRRRPWNLVGLALVSLTLSFVLGTTASYFNTTSVLFGVGDTIMICLAIIVFNAQSRVDFNFCFGFILTVAVTLIISGITYAIFPDLLFMQYVLFGGVGAVVLSMVFVVSIQMMTGWKKDRVQPDEYTTAALFLYLEFMSVCISVVKSLRALPSDRIYDTCEMCCPSCVKDYFSSA